MISIIIPTRNRASVLEKTLSSYLAQQSVTELVIVDDNGSDDLKSRINRWKEKYNKVVFVYKYNELRMGAATSRNIGVTLATNDIVLFGEDDLYLAEDYCEVLLPVLMESSSVGVVSGQIKYLRKDQSNRQALEEYFSSEVTNKTYFDTKKLEITSGIRKQGVLEVAFTHAIFMAKKSTLELYPFDEAFDIGNGYREESTAQIRMYNAGLKNLVVFDSICIHMHRSQVQKGGQRVNRIVAYLYCIKNTSIFYRKYVNNSPIKHFSFVLMYSFYKLLDMFFLPIWKKLNA